MKLKYAVLLLFFTSMAHAQIFPGRAATLADLGYGTDQAVTNLSSSINNSTLIIPVTAGSVFQAYNIATVDSEKIMICSSSSLQLTACSGGRGWGGTAAASHSSGAKIAVYVNSTYINGPTAEIISIENVLLNAANSVLPVYGTYGALASGFVYSTTGTGALSTYASQGTGSKVQRSAGSTTTNDCAKFDSAGNTVDSGGPCTGVSSVSGDGVLITNSLSTGAVTLVLGKTFQGNGSKLQLSTGSPTSGNCAQFDSNGNTADAGAPCGTGGGSGALSSLATSVSGTTLTIGSTCSPTVPCNVRIGATIYAFTSAATAALSSGTGTAYVYVTSAGVLTVGYNGITVGSCTGCTATGSISAFPADSFPVATWPATSGAWGSGTDDRAPFGRDLVIASAPILSSISGGGIKTLSLDATVVSTFTAFTTLTDAATVAWNALSATMGNASLLFTVHSGSRTINITNLVAGGTYNLKIQQDGTGGEGLTLGTGCTWKVAGGGSGAITPSVGANAIDVLTFSYDGTNCYAVFNKNFN